MLSNKNVIYLPNVENITFTIMEQRKYYVAVRLDTNECGIFTTKSGAARYLGVNPITLYRKFNESNKAYKKDRYLVTAASIVKSMNQGNIMNLEPHQFKKKK